MLLLTVKMAQHHLHHPTFSCPPSTTTITACRKGGGCYSVCYRILVRAAAFRTTTGRLALKCRGSAIDSVA